MTDEEFAVAYAKLREEQRRLTDGIHHLISILSAFRGQMDLAVEDFQRQMTELYARFPELDG